MRKSTCDRCGRPGWVNTYIPTGAEKSQGLETGEYCAGCFEGFVAVDRPHVSIGCGHVTGQPEADPDPGWDNVVRALDEAVTIL